MHRSIYVCIYLALDLSIYVCCSIHQFIYLSSYIYLCVDLSIYLSINLSMYASSYLSVCLTLLFHFISTSWWPDQPIITIPSIYLSLSIYLLICLFIYILYVRRYLIYIEKMSPVIFVTKVWQQSNSSPQHHSIITIRIGIFIDFHPYYIYAFFFLAVHLFIFILYMYLCISLSIFLFSIILSIHHS